MWKTFQHEDNLYMIKILQNDQLSVFLTDFQSIWSQSISQDDLLNQFQESNPLFDIKIDEVVREAIETINKISDLEGVEISQDNDELYLILCSKKSGYQIKFKFCLHKSASEIFLKEVTVPLIQTVKHFEERQKMLCSLLKRKDRELEEYKLEKGLISRDDLITEQFDESKLGTADDDSMMDVFGCSKSFWESFVGRYGGSTEAKEEDVKQDPWNQIKRKRKVYSSKTITKKGKGINYGNK